MKRLRLFAWMLAPLFMMALGYLFLLPMPPPPPLPPGVIGIVILDPVDRSILDECPETAPVLARLRPVGMCGAIVPNGSESVQDAIREILTGKNPAKLRQGPQGFDPDTYTAWAVSPWKPQDDDLLTILDRHGYRLQTVIRTDHGVTAAGGGVETVLYPHETEAGALPAAIVVYESRGRLTDSEYLAAVNRTLEPYAERIGTWLVVCPFHRRPVTWRFHINQWLEQNGRLSRTPEGDVDHASSSVFLAASAGVSEPGLRINRHLAYSSGTVSRDEYEGLRKELGKELRHIRVPSPDDPGQEGHRLYSGIYRGEEMYVNRREGWFPDLLCEPFDRSVLVVPELLPDPQDDPWRKAPAGSTVDRPGGWMCLSGPPFDILVEDESKLDMLIAADVAPTVLFLLDLPVARDMQGRVLQPLMTDILQLRVPAVVDGYSVYDPFVVQEF